MIAGILLFLKGVPPWVWKLLGAALVVLGIFGYGAHWQGARDDAKIAAKQAELDTFKATVAAQGKAAQLAADNQKAADLAEKEKADAAHQTAVAALNADIARLRLDSSAGRTVPTAPADSRNPQLACFDRALLGDAVDGFIGDVSRQVASGAAATLDLDNARAWAKNIGTPPASATGGTP